MHDQSLPGMGSPVQQVTLEQSPEGYWSVRYRHASKVGLLFRGAGEDFDGLTAQEAIDVVDSCLYAALDV